MIMDAGYDEPRRKQYEQNRQMWRQGWHIASYIDHYLDLESRVKYEEQRILKPMVLLPGVSGFMVIEFDYVDPREHLVFANLQAMMLDLARKVRDTAKVRLRPYQTKEDVPDNIILSTYTAMIAFSDPVQKLHTCKCPTIPDYVDLIDQARSWLTENSD